MSDSAITIVKRQAPRLMQGSRPRDIIHSGKMKRNFQNAPCTGRTTMEAAISTKMCN